MTKVSEFKTNGRIYAPRAGTKHVEVIIERMKSELIKEGMKEVCKSSNKPTNLSEEEYEGMNMIKKRIKNKELLVVRSDKTRKNITMPMEMYKECGRKHTDKDENISWKKVKTIERTAIHHSKFVRKIFNIGQTKDQERWD